MKKMFKSLFGIFALSALIFTGCENFMSAASEIISTYEDDVKFEKAETVTVTIGHNSDVYGTVGGGRANYEVDAKVGYPFNIDFTLNQNAGNFAGWKAYEKYDPNSKTNVPLPKEEVEFGRDDRLSTDVTVHKAFKNLLFVIPEVTPFPVLNIRLPEEYEGLSAAPATFYPSKKMVILNTNSVDTSRYSVSVTTTADYGLKSGSCWKVYTVDSTGRKHDVTEEMGVSVEQGETYVSTAAKDMGCSKSSVTIDVINNKFNDTIYVEPILVTYPSVQVQVPADYVSLVKTSHSGAVKMAQDNGYQISLTTDPTVGFAGWNLSKVKSDDTYENRTFLLNADLTSIEEGDDTSILFTSDILDIYSPRYDIVKTGKSTGKVQTSVMIMLKQELGDNIYYLEPAFYKHPVVHAVSPEGMIVPGSFSCSSGTLDPVSNDIRLLVGEEYSISFKTTEDYYFAEKAFKVYTKKGDVVKELDSVADSSDISFSFNAVSSDKKGNPSMCTLSLSLEKNFGEELYIEPVLIKYPGMAIQLADESVSAKISPSGNMKFTMGTDNTVTLSTDATVGFKGWELYRLEQGKNFATDKVLVLEAGSAATETSDVEIYKDDFIEIHSPEVTVVQDGTNAGKTTAKVQVMLKKNLVDETGIGFNYILIPALYNYPVIQLDVPSNNEGKVPGFFSCDLGVISNDGTVRILPDKLYSITFKTTDEYCFSAEKWEVFTKEGFIETPVPSSEKISWEVVRSDANPDGTSTGVISLAMNGPAEKRIHFRPILSKVPGMNIGFDPEVPEGAATLTVNNKPYTSDTNVKSWSIKMSQGSAYTVHLTTNKETGFGGWKVIRKAEGEDDEILLSASSATTSQALENPSPYADDFISVTDPKYSMVEASSNAGQVTASVAVTVLKDLGNYIYYLVPELFAYPKVNFESDSNVTMNMNGSVTMLLNKEYEVSCTTNPAYGFGRWKVYTKVNNVETEITDSNDDIEIVKSEPVVSTSRNTFGATSSTLKIVLKKNYGTNLYVKPVVFEHSAVRVKLSSEDNALAEKPASLYVNGEQVTSENVRMIAGTSSQGFEYKLRCETTEDYAFKGWKFYTSIDGGLTKTDFAKTEINARGETVGTTILNGQTTMFGEITVSLDGVVENLYIEPVLKQHPRVNVQLPSVTPAGTDITAGALTVTPYGVIRKLAGEKYTVTATLQPGWIFRGWKLCRDDAEIFNGTNDFTSSEYLSLTEGTVEVFTNGLNAGGTRATVQVELKKELGAFSLYLEPVIEKRSSIMFERPAGFSTMNPASAVYNVAGMSYSLNCATDKTGSFDGWKVTKDETEYPVYTAEIYEGLSTKPAGDFCYETSATSVSDIPAEVLNTATIIFMGISDPVKQYDALNQVTSTVTTTMYLNKYADYDLKIMPGRKNFTQVSFATLTTSANYQSFPSSAVYMETGKDYDIALTTKTGNKFVNTWTVSGASGIDVKYDEAGSESGKYIYVESAVGNPDWTLPAVKNALAVIYVPSEQNIHNEGHSTVNAKIRFMNGNGPDSISLSPSVEGLKRINIMDPSIKTSAITDSDIVSSSGTLVPGTSAIIYAVNGNEFNYRFTTTSAYELLGFAAGSNANNLTLFTNSGVNFKITESDKSETAGKLTFFNKVERKSYDNLKQCITEVTGTIHVYDDSENLYIRPIVKQYPAIEIAGSGTGVISPAGVRNQTQGMEFDIRYTAPVSHGFNGWSVTGSKNGAYTVTEDASALTSEKSIYVCDSLSAEEVPSAAKEKAVLILLNHKVEETEDALGQVSQKVSAKVYVNKVVDEKLTVSASELGYSQVAWDTTNLSSVPETIYMKTGKEYSFRLVSVPGKKISSLTSSAATITSETVPNADVDGSFITTGTIKVTAAEGSPVTVSPTFTNVSQIEISEEAVKGVSFSVTTTAVPGAGEFITGAGSYYQIEGKSISVKYETKTGYDFFGFSENKKFIKDDHANITISDYSVIPITDSLGQERIQVTATFTIKAVSSGKITIKPVVFPKATLSMANMGDKGSVSPTVTLAMRKDADYDISFVTSSGYGFSKWTETNENLPVVALTPTEGYATYDSSIHKSNFILYLGAANTVTKKDGCLAVIYNETTVRNDTNEGVETASAKFRRLEDTNKSFTITPVTYAHSYMYVTADNADVVPAQATKVMVHKGNDYDFKVVTKDGYKWNTTLSFVGGTVENLGNTVNPNFANYSTKDYVCYNVVPAVDSSTGVVTLTGKIRVLNEAETDLVITAGTKAYQTLSIGEINSNDTSRLALKDEIGAGSLQTKFITTYEKNGTDYKIGYTDYVIEAVAAEGKAVYSDTTMWKIYREGIASVYSSSNVLNTGALTLSDTAWSGKLIAVYGQNLEINKDGICKAVAKVRVRDGTTSYVVKPNVYTVPNIQFQEPVYKSKVIGTTSVDGKELVSQYPVILGDSVSFKYTVPKGYAISGLYIKNSAGTKIYEYKVNTDKTVSWVSGNSTAISLDTNNTKADSYVKRTLTGALTVNTPDANGYYIEPIVIETDLSKPQIETFNFSYTPVRYSFTEVDNDSTYENQINTAGSSITLSDSNIFEKKEYWYDAEDRDDEYLHASRSFGFAGKKNIASGVTESTQFSVKILNDSSSRPAENINTPRSLIVTERLYYLLPKMVMNTDNNDTGKTAQLIGNEGFFMFDETESGVFVPKYKNLYTYTVRDKDNNIIPPKEIPTEMTYRLDPDSGNANQFTFGMNFNIPYGGVHQFEFVIEDKGGRKSAPKYVYMDYERDTFYDEKYGPLLENCSYKQVDGGITVKVEWGADSKVFTADDNKFTSMMLHGDGTDSVVQPLYVNGNNLSGGYSISGPVLKRNASQQMPYVRLVNERGFTTRRFSVSGSFVSTKKASPGDIVVRKTGEDKLYYMSLLEYKENPSFGTPIAVVVTPNGYGDDNGNTNNRIIGMGLKIPPRTSDYGVGTMAYCTKSTLITTSSLCNRDDKYGKNNLTQVSKSYGDSNVTESNFPALFYCRNYDNSEMNGLMYRISNHASNANWYLPSVFELTKLNENAAALDEVLAALNCLPVTGVLGYWASSTTGKAGKAYSVGITENAVVVQEQSLVTQPIYHVRAFFDFTDYVEFYTK
ncbi:MAG: hypothetical protein MJ181_05600 [Treponema sp.]|nr:hypothetical protein [Treponema sp.]